MRLASKQVTTFMRSVLIGSEYPVTDTPHFLFPEKFILQTHICVKYQKNPFYFVTYSNSYKIAKKWLQNCRGGVVNSKDAGLRPPCERNATMKRRSNPSKIFYIPAWQTGAMSGSWRNMPGADISRWIFRSCHAPYGGSHFGNRSRIPPTIICSDGFRGDGDRRWDTLALAEKRNERYPIYPDGPLL